ncbi:MAG: type IV secretion system DNA-binding domain-containing protein [Parcubacteria group bacterium]
MPTVQIDISSGQTILSNPMITMGLGIIFLIFLFVIGLNILRYHLVHRGGVNEAFRKKLLLITVPKEKPDEKTGTNITLQQTQEKIGVMETFFSTIAGMKAEKGFKAWLLGRQDVFALEILCHEGKISFYIAMPEKYRQYVEEQIHAQFSNAYVEEVFDYNLFKPQSIVAGKMLELGREYFFPIKTYKKFETDPLNSITNVLSKVNEKDGAAIQIIIRSAHRSWHDLGARVATKLQQGKKMKQAIAEARGGFSGFFRGVKEAIVIKEQSKPQSEYRLSPMEGEVVKAIEEKTSKAGVDANIRIIVSSANQASADSYLTNIANSFNQYNVYKFGNGFKTTGRSMNRLAHDFIFRKFDEGRKIILNTEELASLFHLPIPFVNEAPNIRWLESKKAPAPLNIPAEGLFLGLNTYRGKEVPIYMKTEDRFRHMYVIGMTGTGKTYFISELAMQDINAGEGMCFIDPHGPDVEEILARVPKERAEDVIFFDPTDFERPIALNMLEFETPEEKTFVVNEIMNIFDKLYDLRATGGPMFEQYFKNACYLVMSDPASGSTLAEIPKVLADEEFRKMKLSKCDIPTVKDFWEKEAQKAGGEAALANMVPYITSKLAPFLANDMMRPIVSQQKSTIDFKEAMAKKKIILVKLAKGKIGNINAYLLGMIIVGKILMAAMSRVDMSKEERKDFFLYIDEFQNVLTESIESILSEARKFRLALIIAHQYVAQLVKPNDTKIRDAVFGNVGTKVSFRIGVEDAQLLAKEFAPVFSEYDLINVPAKNCFVRLLVDNANPPGFNMKVVPHESIPGVPPADPELAKAIKQLSRLKYGKDRKIIEMEVKERVGKVLEEIKEDEDDDDDEND